MTNNTNSSTPLDDLEQSAKRPILPIYKALIPVVFLIALLFYNVFYAFKDDALSGSNQFILILGAAVAGIVGYTNKTSYKSMMKEVANNLKATTSPIIILLMVGALAGTWLVSGIIPSMIYYGLDFLSPSIFLASSLIICGIISLATGSSWTTSATVGIALIGIADALNVPLGMTAGAILSGAYFGDKISPLSDTTNLAPAMAGTDLFTHIRYMLYTTVPTILITLVFFIIIGFTLDTSGNADPSSIQVAIKESFVISPILFIVPAIVVFLIIKKTSPLIALLIGTILGAIAALIFQPEILATLANTDTLTPLTAYQSIMNAITIESSIPTENALLEGLFTSGGMQGMLNTVWLIICAMIFGGVMDAIGALDAISRTLLKLFHTTFGLFASTVASCLAVNLTASDQYLSLVIPGKMYAQAYKDKGLAPENHSRTLEDSGTVTSVLIPWNTCGAYHSGVLGVSPLDYIAYAMFNWLSPFTTLFFAAFRIKIRELQTPKNKG